MSKRASVKVSVGNLGSIPEDGKSPNKVLREGRLARPSTVSTGKGPIGLSRMTSSEFREQ